MGKWNLKGCPRCSGNMFPSEMVILMAIAQTRACGNKLLTRPMDVTGEYIGYLCNSVVRRGYTSGNHSMGYRLTPKGTEALYRFVRQNEPEVKETIKILQQLGIEIGQE